MYQSTKRLNTIHHILPYLLKGTWHRNQQHYYGFYYLQPNTIRCLPATDPLALAHVQVFNSKSRQNHHQQSRQSPSSFLTANPVMEEPSVELSGTPALES